MGTYGYPQSDWDRAKGEAKTVLYDYARRGHTITYTELTQRISTIPFGPHNRDFHGLLDAVSRDEEEEGRGLLSVLVVRKDGDIKPGPGFFSMAEDVGREFHDELAFWISEFEAVVKANKKRPR
ncbi:hypothetical protein [Methylobacterium bullatum]|uniref:Uncharacterized protein n=1 Tax=Methylobacterium bullatum TaxID=570505 RepID=A0A679JP45_9HYPH|nr:hypothetical protein MBLL_00378 [Methylobacterium bullatum]